MRKLLAFVFVCLSLYSHSQGTIVPICGGTSATIQATNPNNLTGPTYSLNPGGFPPLPGTANFVVSPPVTSSYTLYTTGQNTNNVTVTNSIVIQVSITPQPSVNPTFTQATCTNSLNTVNLGLTFNPASPATTNYTVTWLPQPPTSITTPVQTTATAFPAGPYTVQVAAPGGCSVQTTFTMTSQPAPANFSVIPYGSTHSITCLQPTLVLNATIPAFNYTWSSTSTLPVENDTVQLNATNLGTIVVLGQNPASGCTATHTFLIAQNISVPSATLSTTSIAINCTQTLAPTLSVSASPSVNVSNYIYSPCGGTFVANSYTTIMPVTCVGIFTHVAINDANGCTSGVQTLTVTSNDNYPKMTVTSPNSFTLGCNTKSVGTIVITQAATTPTPGGPVSYTVLGPPTSTAIATPSLSGNNTFTVNVPGTWTVLTMDNTNGCITRQPVSVLQNTFVPLIKTTVPRQILDCTYSTTVLEGFTETPNVKYTWSFVNPSGPGNLISQSITVVPQFTAPTQTLINTYTLTVMDNNNTCSDFTLVPMYQNISPPNTGISGTNSLTCNQRQVTLSNQSTSNIPAVFPHPLNVIGFLWQGPTPQTDLQVNSTYVAGTPGVYTLTAKDLNNGCTSKGTFTLLDRQDPPQILSTTRGTIDCGVVQSSVGINVPAPMPTFSWIPPAGAPGVSTSSTFPVSVPGTYTAILTNSITGCKTTTVVSAITGSISANLSASEESGYAPLTVKFTDLSQTSTGSVNISSFWNFGNGTKHYITPPTSTNQAQATFKQAGTYTVVMFAIKGACIDTAQVVIKVEVPASLEIPNVFTPNGDGINDLFFLKATNLSDINMTIFDRWGHVVYELKTDVGAIEWDGKNQYGNEAADGTYFYTIKATGKDGQTWDKKGTINLFR